MGVGGRQEWRKDGLYRGKRGVAGVRGRKNNRMRQTSLPCVHVCYTNGMTLLHVKPEKQVVPPFVYNESK